MSAPPAPPVAPLPVAPRVPPHLRDLVGHVLRGGVILSGVLLVAGLVWEAAVGRANLLASPVPSTGAALAGVFEHGGPAAVVLLGLLVLIATPLSRVAISVATFAAARDRPFTLITLFVLLVLGLTVVVGVLR